MQVQEALLFLVRALTDLYLLTFLLRFLLQCVRADFYNPLAQFIVKVTNPLVIPARRLIPSAGGVDLPTLVVLVLLQVAVTCLLLTLGGEPLTVTEVAKWTVLQLISLVLLFYFISILIYVILSWVARGEYHPVASVLAAVNEPILRPVRRLIPPIGGLDLSPLVVLLLIQALRIALS